MNYQNLFKIRVNLITLIIYLKNSLYKDDTVKLKNFNSILKVTVKQE